MVEKAMGDITRATRKVLMDYDTRRQVEAFAQTYQKSDDQVISEAEHIVTSSGMDFTDDYKIIKDNIILSGKTFAEEAVHDFKNETPIFQKKIEDCLFCFEDFQNLDDKAIRKVLRDTDMQELAKALRGASTEVQNRIFRNMSQRAAAMLKEDSGSLYIYRNEPAIFGLENRRDKPTTLNLQKSSPGKIRTYTTRIQRLAHYQLCYRRRPCQKYSKPK